VRLWVAGFLIAACTPGLAASATLRLRCGLEGQGAPGRCYERIDMTGELRGRFDLLRLRTREGRLIGGGVSALPAGVRVSAGRLRARWGTGAVFHDPNRLDLDVQTCPRGLPLEARPTTAWVEHPRAGGVVHWAATPVEIAAWQVGEYRGCALGWGPVALAALCPSHDGADPWWGSVVLSYAAGGDRACLEIAGTDPRRPWRRVGGTWRIGLSPVLGSVSGSFRCGEPADAQPPPAPEHGWVLAWSLPVMRGIAPELDLSRIRRRSASDAVPVDGEHLRLELRAAPWNGATTRLVLHRSVAVRCRADPPALTGETRSAFDLEASVRCGDRMTWTLHFRQASGSVAVGEEQWPRGMAPLLDPAAPDPPDADAADRALYLERDPGAIAWSRLRWDGGSSWRGSLLIAASPVDGGPGGAVPVRIPPGTSSWRTLGTGCWLLEAWAGRRISHLQIEGAVRYISGEATGARAVWARLGLAWKRAAG